MDEFDEFARDLEEHKKSSNRADFYKLSNGDNRIVLLSNPVGYSEMFNVGIAYEDCGYGKYATRRYKCYVLDMKDGLIKMANFSYTVASLINDLRIASRTKFESLPCPYVMNLRTENAGKKEVKTSVLAEEDYSLTEQQKAELESYDSVRDILERLKNAQKKKVESDSSFRDKIDGIIASKEIEENERKEKKQRDGTIPSERQDIGEIQLEEEINLDDIPF